MTTIAEIEAATKPLADARAALADTVGDLNAVIDKAKRQALPKIRREVAMVATRQARLKALVEAAPDLFKRPRTAVFYGIKVGYSKGKGAIKFADEQRVIELIRKKLPKKADHLLSVTTRVSKEALSKLSADELKAIGCSIEDAQDGVVIKPTDSAVDKLVDALIKDATKDDDEREAA